jgi:hypothetical protein
MAKIVTSIWILVTLCAYFLVTPLRLSLVSGPYIAAVIKHGLSSD